ncbi:MAG: bifunctional phosphoribosylaminoimidazolecarboxamide formyltransferase/IMP cyclohydrolase, partial [Vicinamibacterales bacterium]|nr:bifunctional phosphoribosylaminoimidazolecarboxamide formyltransferase/IMP cyclohydrolase [Vicinamibacterales bacterium]
MRALLSVSDKSNLVDFARGLLARGYELVSTGGTARALADAGLSVTAVSSVTGFPEMMDGRVKTLHPAVHAGILARRDRPDDLQAIADEGISPIDVVVVNLYPFARAAADPSTTVPALIEEIDIGGPTLIRAAAKNFRHVLVVVDPADYDDAMAQLDQSEGPSDGFRLSLAAKAFAHTRSYDGTIAETLSGVEVTDGAFSRGT